MVKTDVDQGDRGGQRLDKWLWFARIAKTRTLASRLVENGKARVNKSRVSKASRTIRPGDVVTLAIHDQIKVLRIIAIGERRGPAAEARELYEDLSPPPVPRPHKTRLPSPAAREKGSGRPTKRDRRRIDAWQVGRSSARSTDSENR